ncbi:hypothetical protein, partial [Cloacibacillus porcorum]|uniref:hypothetical protein n=2 Tax=Cloacibacillus porcorum TaxID=1197717 RepID=UPI00267158E8
PIFGMLFTKRGEGELTLCSSAAFAAGSVWRGSRAKQSNTPSVSPQKRRRSTSDVTTSRIAQIRRALIWLPGRLREEGFKKKPLFIINREKDKPLFISFPTRRKSVLKIHMTAGKSVRRSAVG